MTFRNRVIVDPIRTLAFGAIGAAFAPIGAAVASPVRIFLIKNFTDVNIDFSIDGVNINFILLSSTGQVIDLTANKVKDDGFFIREGTIFYARQSAGAPTLGNVHVEIIRSLI